MTPDDVAASVGVHRMTVLRWERGERAPGADHVTALARVLDMELHAVSECFAARRDTWSTPAGPSARGLRALRTAADVRVATLAERTGVPPATIYNWEAGRARVPAVLLPALCDVFDLDEDALVARMRQPGPPIRPARSQLRLWRTRAGLSQEEAAAQVGSSRSTLGSWERGAVPPPWWALRAMARAYGVPLRQVAAACGRPPSPWLDARNWRPDAFPQVLQVLREWAGLTQAQLAARCGVSSDTVRAWEAGRTRPFPRNIERLELALGMSSGSLDALHERETRHGHTSTRGSTATG